MSTHTFFFDHGHARVAGKEKKRRAKAPKLLDVQALRTIVVAPARGHFTGRAVEKNDKSSLKRSRPAAPSDQAGMAAKKKSAKPVADKQQRSTGSGRTEDGPNTVDEKNNHKNNNNNDIDQAEFREQFEKEETERIGRTLGMSQEQMEALDAAERSADAEVENYRKAFIEFDQDGSGDISPEELRDALNKLGEKPEEIEELVRQADKDGDGTIDLEEFIAMMKARKRAANMARALESDNSREDGALNLSVNAQLNPHVSNLPPLKLPTGHVSRKMARFGPNKRLVAQNKSKRQQQQQQQPRATPHVLRTGSQANQDALKRELAATNKMVKKMEGRVNDTLAWVQENCDVTSIKAQLYCKRWGMQKLENILKRIEFKDVIYAWKQWRRLVQWKRNQEQVDQYMKLKGSRRLTSLFANWKRKQSIAAFNAWLDQTQFQQRLERLAAVVQIQRAMRGHLGRQHATRELRTSSAVTIQRVVRGLLARRRCAALRLARRRNEAAVSIQRCYRGYQSQKLAKVMMHARREERAATLVQGLYRSRKARRVFAALRRQYVRETSATDIARVWRGFRIRQITWARQQAIAENTAAVWIQKFVRGYQGRLHGLGLIETRLVIIAENEAALKIQCLVRGYRARIAVQRLRVERAAVAIQTRWRAHKDCKGYRIMRLENAKKVERRRAAAICIQCFVRCCAARSAAAERREQTAAAMRIQRIRRGQIGRKNFADKKLAYNQALRREQAEQQRAQEEAAAARIQAACRGRKVRAELQSKRTEEKQAAEAREALKRGEEARKQEERAAAIIQSQVRGRVARRQVEREKKNMQERLEASAVMIQKHWRAKQARSRVRQVHAEEAHRALMAMKMKEMQRKRKEEEELAAIKLQAMMRTKMAQDAVAQKRAQLRVAREREEQEAARMLQEKLQREKARREAEEEAARRAKAIEEEQDAQRRAELELQQRQQEAAVVIQSFFCMLRDRARVARIRQERQKRQEEEKRLREESAATLIQARFRAKRDRERFKELKERREWEENNRRQARIAREKEERRKAAERRAEAERREALALQREQEEEAALKMQALMRGKAARAEVANRRAKAEKDKLRLLMLEEEKRLKEKQELAALKIQCWFRTKKARSEMQRRTRAHQQRMAALREQGEKEEELLRIQEEQEQEIAATKMQNLYRGKLARIKAEARRQDREKELERERAAAAESLRQLSASKIQATWRGYADRKAIKKKQASRPKSRASILSSRPSTVGDALGAEPGAEDDPYKDWVQYFDEGSQCYYWFHTITQEARWTDPRDDAAAGYQTDGNATDYMSDNNETNMQGYYDEYGQWIEGHYDEYGNWVSSNGQPVQAVPDDPNEVWEQYYDDSYNCGYYFNLYTYETSWELPPGFISKYNTPEEAPRYQG